MKTTVILLLMLAGVSTSASAAAFASQRLRELASLLSLNGLDTLSSGTHYTYYYRGRPLSVRVNDYGEVEHIGLLLFPESHRQVAQPLICDFVERNILERLMKNLSEEMRFLQGNEHVTFLKGGPQTALSLDTTSATSIIEERMDFKTYLVAWHRDDRELLAIVFDMDYQLLTGCGTQELENRFMQRLIRFRPHEHRVLNPLFPRHSNVYVAAGDTFLIKELRNDLYYKHDDKGWHLIDDSANASKALANMLLSLDFEGTPMLRLKMNKYPYDSDTLTLPYRHWLQMCLDEGCTPFFGIKNHTEDAYQGTVLMSNPKAGYVHLLSVDIPTETIEGQGNRIINGQLYVYTAMHNLSDDYFKIGRATRTVPYRKKQF